MELNYYKLVKREKKREFPLKHYFEAARQAKMLFNSPIA